MQAVVKSIVKGAKNYFSLAKSVQEKLISLNSGERYWHVLVGSDCSCHVKYQKYISLSIAGIRVIVFVNENYSSVVKRFVKFEKVLPTVN